MLESAIIAEGWALLGRTYKATEHYTEARDAFRHALEAAPGDAALEREYAAVTVAPAVGNAVATPVLLPVSSAPRQAGATHRPASR